MPEESPVAPPPRLTVRLVRNLLILLVLSLAVHLILPQIATLEHSLQVIRNMKLWAMALAVAMQALSYGGSGFLRRASVGVVGQRLSVLRDTLITTAAYSIGLVAGGMVGNAAATYRWLHNSGVSAEGALLTGWLPGLLYDTALVMVSIFGLLYPLVVHQLTSLQVIAFASVLLLLGLIAVAVLWGVGHRLQLTALTVRVVGRWAGLRHRPYDPATTQAATERLFHAWDVLRAGAGVARRWGQRLTPSLTC